LAAEPPVAPIIVLRAKAGDRAAFEVLLAGIQGPLFRYLRHLLTDVDLAQDVLQETLMQVYRKITWLREPTLLLPWAYRIASREAFRRLRVRRRLAETTLDDAAAEGVEPSHADDAILDALPRFLESISPASRSVLTLHYIEELSLSEIAAILGLSQGTVKSRLAYGLVQLRRALEAR
jgi:RNA polymerase sigma-70 factor (ECF subfamily)